MVNIRAGLEADKEQLLTLGNIFYVETAYGKSLPYDRESTWVWAKMGIDQGLFFVAEDGGRIVGLVGGIAMPHMFNSAYTVGTELFWFVDHKYRGLEVGVALIKSIEEAARQKGLKFWTMVALESHNAEKVGKFYEGFGYKRAEHSYVKEF